MLETIWQSAYDFILTHLPHLPYISPFWYWLSWGALATAVAFVIGWAFPALRSFSGAVILAVIAGLSGYRRGEYDQYHHDRGER
jgi:hypothetical protein